MLVRRSKIQPSLRPPKLGRPPKNKEPDRPREGTSTSLEFEIDRQIGDLVPQKARDEVVRRVSTTVRAEMFSGPIAHPKHLREYEDICPGAADRIIRMAERETDHAIEMDNKIIAAETSDQKLGMWFGMIGFVLVLALAAISGLYFQNPVITGLFLGTAVIGVIGRSINGRSKDADG